MSEITLESLNTKLDKILEYLSAKNNKCLLCDDQKRYHYGEGIEGPCHLCVNKNSLKTRRRNPIFDDMSENEIQLLKMEPSGYEPPEYEPCKCSHCGDQKRYYYGSGIDGPCLFCDRYIS